jgi:hypothetical protein
MVMKAEALNRRIRTLEAEIPTQEPKSIWKEILPQCTIEELRRLRKIRLQIIEEQREPTEEEACFLAELRTKYGT